VAAVPAACAAALQRHEPARHEAVAFRFTPVGAGAAFQLDDVYLDPWKST
jgi:hypothetical protein